MIYQIIYKALNRPCLLMTAKSGKNLDTITKSVQENLNKIADWCNLWGFKISLNKTVAVIFSQRRIPDIGLSIDNKNSSGDEIANVNFFYNIAHVEASAYAH